MFKIGDFSKMVRVSPRMLRHYEKCGLLYPAATDPLTGYRQYSAGQIPLLTNIVTLRDLGFSIDEIGDILPHFADATYMVKVLHTKAASVKSIIEAEQDKYERLMEMGQTMQKERNIMVNEVELKTLPAVKAITLRSIIPHYNEEGLLWERLGKYIGENQIPCRNTGYSIYYDEEYKEADPDVEIAVPVDVPGTSQGEFIYKEYAEIPLAATVRFSGAYDGGYDAAWEKLAGWMDQNGYIFAGSYRGYTIARPGEKGNGLTELQAPVMKK